MLTRTKSMGILASVAAGMLLAFAIPASADSVPFLFDFNNDITGTTTGLGSGSFTLTTTKPAGFSLDATFSVFDGISQYDVSENGGIGADPPIEGKLIFGGSGTYDPMAITPTNSKLDIVFSHPLESIAFDFLVGGTDEAGTPLPGSFDATFPELMVTFPNNMGAFSMTSNYNQGHFNYAGPGGGQTFTHLVLTANTNKLPSLGLDNLSVVASLTPEFGSVFSLGGLLAAGGAGMWVQKRRIRNAKPTK